ncbi:MAG TPA: PD-(D/E)XK nuclease superfamily protein [Polyangiaceae bacterium]|jgi:hypothetical protein|nr:PD-(D/E)XK nuclease superfamily protein [Polyangiaceae bacterium]
MTGNDYRKWVGNYIASAYGSRGLVVYEEVQLGTSIIGKQRRIDLLIIAPDQTALVVECKYQDSAGTADEKIPYALNDMAALRVPGVLVYAGSGFSPGVLHLLQGSEFGAYCMPEPGQSAPQSRRAGAMDSGTWQFDHVVAQTFRFWDIVLGNRRPLQADPNLNFASPEAPQQESLLALVANRDPVK